MKRVKMAVITVLTVALMMTWAVPALAEDLAKVNINEASVEELTNLDGVGQKYAERIVAFREKNGPFQTPEDLLLVKGIGKKILDRNIERIHIEGK